VARRLSKTAIPQDGMAARLSGDKFALLMPGASREQAEEIAVRIHKQFEEPATIGQSRIDISAGIGICCAPEHATTVEQAMSRAEVAMYAAKQSKSLTVVYEPKLDSSSEDSLSLLSDLREAILNKDLRLHYQPKVDLASGLIVGAEALARWNHPLRGPMPPYAFIPFAEQTGFIGQITEWAIAETCMMISRMQALGHRLKISANISTRDLLDHAFLKNLQKALSDSGADASLLCLEVTESALMDNPERSLQAMSSIRSLGVELSIDDFGTGYSSLGYLRKMPINEIKIDRVFIVGLTSGSETDEKIVSSTIELAHGLGLRVVAEGTEDPLAFTKLRAAGCDQAQGFGLSRPIPEHLFAEFLNDWRPSRMPG
jgi:predicted signal transduction protein with EAL and GGDEF domain